jgi:UDP-N-acetylglucosamine 1-carboxyvinyltransferase
MSNSSEKFVIKGGKPLKGTVAIMGSKNAALPILSAALLTKEPCVIGNLPLIEDVFRMIDVLKELGAEVSWLGKRKIKIKSSNINPTKLSPKLVGFLRGSILILGPLLTRFSNLKMPLPGGCLIGARSLDTHLDAFEQIGVKSSLKNNCYFFEKNSDFKPLYENSYSKTGKILKRIMKIILKEFSVTATENILSYSASQPKEIVLKIADQDYQVQELVSVLRKMGAKIEYNGANSVKIFGNKKLKGFSHNLMSDPIEAGTFIVAALATQGEVLIENAEFSFLELFLKRLKDFGAKIEILGPKLIKVFPSGRLTMDKIQSLPYPGIHTDLQPELGVLATLSKGLTLIQDPLFEGRLRYLEDLNKMGASIIFCDPHRAIVKGFTELHGIEIPSSNLRAGAALIIAGLIAKGETVLGDIYQIDRGYERIEERLQKLGADIKRVKDI